MSIILKGIDLDEITAGNGYARLEIEEDGTVVDDISDIIIAQAIQIDRPHGRLIDGDELKLARHDIYVEEIKYRHRCIHIENIDEAPTILEAEE